MNFNIEIVEKLIDHNKKQIKKFVYSKIKVFYPKLISKYTSIYQDTLIKIWQKRDIYNPEKDFKIWCFFWANIVIRQHAYNKPKCWQELPVENLDQNEHPQDNFDSDLDEEEVYFLVKRLLKIICLKGGAPHQTLVYLHRKMISNWKRKKIYNRLSNNTLNYSFKNFIKKYKRESMLSDDDLIECIGSLNIKLNKHVGEVQERRTACHHLTPIISQKSGETYIKDYYNQKPLEDISNWIRRVNKRVINSFKDLT